ncbi:MAG: hypothetical protein IJ180_00425 [Bacteroidales bacterium]|nr:hypothetical protein [Bacteroidales bacterium]
MKYTTSKAEKSEFSVRPQTLHKDTDGKTVYCLDIEEAEKEDEEGNKYKCFLAYVIIVPETATNSNVVKHAIKTLWSIEDENELQNNFVAGENKLFPTTAENNEAKARYKTFLSEVIALKEQVRNDLKTLE